MSSKLKEKNIPKDDIVHIGPCAVVHKAVGVRQDVINALVEGQFGIVLLVKVGGVGDLWAASGASVDNAKFGCIGIDRPVTESVAVV